MVNKDLISAKGIFKRRFNKEVYKRGGKRGKNFEGRSFLSTFHHQGDIIKNLKQNTLLNVHTTIKKKKQKLDANPQKSPNPKTPIHIHVALIKKLKILKQIQKNCKI